MSRDSQSSLQERSRRAPSPSRPNRRDPDILPSLPSSFHLRDSGVGVVVVVDDDVVGVVVVVVDDDDADY